MQKSVRVPSIRKLYAGHFDGTCFTLPTSSCSGVPIALAAYSLCPKCHMSERYEVYSHDTLLYRNHCLHCQDAAYCDTRWYSKSTARVQELMAEALPDYREKFLDPVVQVQRRDTALLAHRLVRDINRSRFDAVARHRVSQIRNQFSDTVPAVALLLDYHNM